MALRNQITQQVALPRFAGPTTQIPTLRSTSLPVGGGPSPVATPLDPSGLVPVNRTQPVATDGAEAQRLMERRLGSMPPSSFAGAGAGFVPLDRGGSPVPMNLGEVRTMNGPVVQPTGQPHDLGQEDIERIKNEQRIKEAHVANGRGLGIDINNLPPGLASALPPGLDVSRLRPHQINEAARVYINGGLGAAQQYADRLAAGQAATQAAFDERFSTNPNSAARLAKAESRLARLQGDGGPYRTQHVANAVGNLQNTVARWRGLLGVGTA